MTIYEISYLSENNTVHYIDIKAKSEQSAINKLKNIYPDAIVLDIERKLQRV